MKLLVIILIFFSLISCGAKKKIAVQTEIITSSTTVQQKDSTVNKVSTSSQTENKAVQEEIVTEVIEYTQTATGESVVAKKTTQTHKIQVVDSVQKEEKAEEVINQDTTIASTEDVMVSQEEIRETEATVMNTGFWLKMTLVLLCVLILCVLKMKKFFK